MITDTRGVKALCGYVESKLCKGGDGADIDVTAEVGQTIVVKEVDANGKPTKWEAVDYQPRTHWDEMGEILPEKVIEIDPDTGLGVILSGTGTYTKGQPYVVHYNGNAYQCVAQAYEEEVEEGTFAEIGVCLGNMDLMTGMGDSGEPFVLLISYPEFAESAGMWGSVASLDGAESVMLSIDGLVPHKIPEKYLPQDYMYEVPFGVFEYENINNGQYEGYKAVVHEIPVALLEAMNAQKHVYVKCEMYTSGEHVYKSVAPAQYGGLIDGAYVLADKTQKNEPITSEMAACSLTICAHHVDPTRQRLLPFRVSFNSADSTD